MKLNKDKCRLGHFELSESERREWNEMFKEFDVKVAEPEKEVKEKKAKKKKAKKKKTKAKKEHKETKKKEVEQPKEQPTKREQPAGTRCDVCGSRDVVELKNGNKVCLDCKRTVTGIEIIDPRHCELQKIWKYKGDIHIKITTALGSRNFIKSENGLYEEFVYTCLETFTRRRTGRKVDFSDALEKWLG